MANLNETLSTPKTTHVSYDVEGKDQIITLKNGVIGTSYRIEKVSETRLNVYEWLGGREMDAKIYKRAK